MRVLAAAIGLIHGLATSAAVVVFLSILGIVPQLAVITNTRRYVNLYGVILGLGGVLFAAADLLDWRIPIADFWQAPILALFITLWGGFTGILLSALAEVFDIFPALTGRLGVRDGLKALLLSLAIGKSAGAAISLFSEFFPA